MSGLQPLRGNGLSPIYVAVVAVVGVMVEKIGHSKPTTWAEFSEVGRSKPTTVDLHRH